MTVEELNIALYQKMFDEQDDFVKHLETLTPKEILNPAYEYTTRQDILLSLEENDLSAGEATQLLKQDKPLSAVFSVWEKRETPYMKSIFETMSDTARQLLQRENSSMGKER
ncbi:MAG: hypothetical protein BGN88_00955 [Clostridiales bacterium 43-6]|nr:MAG: hypothetical protein BGN88_00955 [Clostridiales bacterium 43-6]